MNRVTCGRPSIRVYAASGIGGISSEPPRGTVTSTTSSPSIVRTQRLVASVLVTSICSTDLGKPQIWLPATQVNSSVTGRWVMNVPSSPPPSGRTKRMVPTSR